MRFLTLSAALPFAAALSLGLLAQSSHAGHTTRTKTHATDETGGAGSPEDFAARVKEADQPSDAAAAQAKAKADALKKRRPGLSVGQKAPNFRLQAVAGPHEGRRIGPKDMFKKKGGFKKGLVISFFATTCRPCIKELPELARLEKKYRDQGLGVLLVSTDPLDQQEKVLDIAKKAGVEFDVLHGKRTVRSVSMVFARYKGAALPYTLFVSPDRTVKQVHTQYTTTLEEDVQALLKQ